MRLKLISCEIFFRELCRVVADAPHRVDLEFLPKGLHDVGSAAMKGRLQEAVDQVDTVQYDAVLLGYGLCNNGVVGLRAPERPLVVPRAHDCITLFLGNKDRYLEYFHENPGVYFLTSGWLERNETGELRQASIQHRSGMDWTYEELVAKYGEENARFLQQELAAAASRNYRQVTFIEMGLAGDGHWEQQARQEASRRNWTFDKISGSWSLFQRLVGGTWDDRDFLVVPPGKVIKACYDEGIVAVDTDQDEAA